MSWIDAYTVIVTRGITGQFKYLGGEVFQHSGDVHGRDVGDAVGLRDGLVALRCGPM